jgi:hypothetical protein
MAGYFSKLVVTIIIYPLFWQMSLRFLDFGTVKVSAPTTQSIQMLNRGKYGQNCTTDENSLKVFVSEVPMSFDHVGFALFCPPLESSWFSFYEYQGHGLPN